MPVEFQLEQEEGGRLSRAWYGPQAPHSQDQAILDINAWCLNNLVPEDTKRVLVSVLTFLIMMDIALA